MVLQTTQTTLPGEWRKSTCRLQIVPAFAGAGANFVSFAHMGVVNSHAKWTQRGYGFDIHTEIHLSEEQRR